MIRVGGIQGNTCIWLELLLLMPIGSSLHFGYIGAVYKNTLFPHGDEIICSIYIKRGRCLFISECLCVSHNSVTDFVSEASK